MTYLARTAAAPVPASETQALLFLRADHVVRLGRETMTLEALLRDGAELIQHSGISLDAGLPLDPLFQLSALAVLLDWHADLLGVSDDRATEVLGGAT